MRGLPGEGSDREVEAVRLGRGVLVSGISHVAAGRIFRDAMFGLGAEAVPVAREGSSLLVSELA